jgi:hypothetical protein
MREICSYGSEGGGTETNQPSLPLFESRPFGPQIHVLRERLCM